MSHPLDIIIIERLGAVKQLSIKEFKEDLLFKKCGFKKSEDFIKQTEWSVKMDGKKYFIQLFAKAEGRANSENKYDFPPPVDTKLFYGTCAIVGQIKKDDGSKAYVNLTVPFWNKVYEKLFGGFEDLSKTAKEDEEEEDELENVPKEKKTKNGYLKDGFVVDSSDTEDQSESGSEESEEESGESTEETSESEETEDMYLEDVGSELSEESYDYDDDNVGK